jgi:hypothetical protein
MITMIILIVLIIIALTTTIGICLYRQSNTIIYMLEPDLKC